MCYTNHALDDILEGLINIGIPVSSMLRLGGKSTASTEPLLLQNQQRGGGPRTHDQWDILNSLRNKLEKLFRDLEHAFRKCNSPHIEYSEIFSHLEFCFPEFHSALQVPDLENSNDGMVMIGTGGRKMKASYLMERWKDGQDAGVFVRSKRDPDAKKIWDMRKNERLGLWKQWEERILQDDIEELARIMSEYNKTQKALAGVYNTHMVPLLQSKRVVGCTTTAAAKYSDEIQAFNPDVLLVEEAGEILESHILTALGPETSQLILIGDHKCV